MLTHSCFYIHVLYNPEGALVAPYRKKHSSTVFPVFWRTLLSELMNLNTDRFLQTLEHSNLSLNRFFPFEAA